MDTYKTYRLLLTPRWPLGLPGGRDGWIALALTTEDADDRHGTTLLALWRRDGVPETVTVPLPWTAGADRPCLVFEAGPGRRTTGTTGSEPCGRPFRSGGSALLSSFGADPGGTSV